MPHSGHTLRREPASTMAIRGSARLHWKRSSRGSVLRLRQSARSRRLTKTQQAGAGGFMSSAKPLRSADTPRSRGAGSQWTIRRATCDGADDAAVRTRRAADCASCRGDDGNGRIGCRGTQPRAPRRATAAAGCRSARTSSSFTRTNGMSCRRSLSPRAAAAAGCPAESRGPCLLDRGRHRRPGRRYPRQRTRAVEAIPHGPAIDVAARPVRRPRRRAARPDDRGRRA